MILVDLELEQLYDGKGQHIGGIYPPLLVGRELTPAFYEAVSERIAAQKVTPFTGATDLALVYMVPRGIVGSEMSPLVLGALVQAVDAGGEIVVHADSPETAFSIGNIVARFVGGGRA